MELAVCCNVDVIKGGLTGIFLLDFSFAVISSSELKSNSSSFVASSSFFKSRFDFLVLSLKITSLSSCLIATSSSQYSFGENDLISFSLSTTSLTATD